MTDRATMPPTRARVAALLAAAAPVAALLAFAAGPQAADPPTTGQPIADRCDPNVTGSLGTMKWPQCAGD